ncbi:MAG: ATP-binding protein [bacterium]
MRHANDAANPSVDETQAQQSPMEALLRGAPGRQLLAAFPDTVFVTRRDGTILSCSANNVKDLLLTPTELAGKQLQALPGGAARTRLASALAQIRAGAKNASTEYALAIDGQTRCFEARLSPLGDDWVLALMRNVTERRKVEDQLETSVSLLGATLESTADGILVVNTDGKIVSLNRKFIELWRIPAQIIATCDDNAALAFVVDQLAEPAAFLDKVKELYHTPDAESFDVLEFRDGRVFERYSIPQRIGGRCVGRVWSFRDVTERNRAQAALRAAKDAAEASSNSKSAFLASMSHEIRTPMNAIIGMTELVLDTVLSEQQRDDLGVVQSSAHSLLTLINDILDFSKIEAGKLEFEEIEFDVRQCVDEMLRTLAVRANEKKLSLSCEVENDVPERIVGDAGRLRQVLMNLAGNAIKFTDAGSVVVAVRCAAADPPNAGSDERCHLEFRVRDTGIGIPLEKQKSIFNPFTQADGSTTRKYGGTGLGLTIASRLVALMGGELTVESAPGAGSKFRFDARFGIGRAQDAAS